MNKHTPGPWILDSPDCDPTIDDSSGNCVISGNRDGCLYARVAADLVLATAAPDLLEALDSIVEAFWLSCDDLPDEFDARQEVIKARAAIAKARGEA